MDYRFANEKDIDLLTSMRLASLNFAGNEEAYHEVRKNCLAYFQKSVPGKRCEAILAETCGRCVGVGILFYYTSVPSAFNPKGKNAYLACMYVEPAHRGAGIGTAILNRLLARAKEQGYDVVLLNSSELGRPLYEKAGFQPVENAMVCKR